MEREFVGIDLGTTSFKGTVLNLDHGRLGPVAGPAPPCIGGPGAKTMGTRSGRGPDQRDGIFRDLLRTAPNAAGLVMCSQMHSVVLTDERGRAIEHHHLEGPSAPLKRQRKGGTIFDRLLELVSPEERAEIGGELRNGIPIGTLFALAGEGLLPPVASRRRLPDFVVANLWRRQASYGGDQRGRPRFVSPRSARLAQGTDRPAGARRHELARNPANWRACGLDRVGRQAAGLFHAGGGISSAPLVRPGLGERELSLNISTGSQASLLGRERPGAAAISWSDPTSTANGSAPSSPFPRAFASDARGFAHGDGSGQADPWDYDPATRWMRFVRPISKSISRSSSA